VRKFDVPFTGPPAWLDAAAEVPMRAEGFADRNDFCVRTMGWLLALGLTPRQSAELAANVATETAWGESWYCGNGGGWKITQAFARAHKERTGTGAPWWKAPGNVDSADSPWCFYRVFPDATTFLGAWCEHFVPRPEVVAPPYPAYQKAGAAFWRGDEEWFGELILAGYKGSPSRKRLRELRAEHRPDTAHPSVRDHASMSRDILTRWAQHALGVTVDGRWGLCSEKAAASVRKAAGLEAHGDLDDELCALLASHLRPSHIAA